MASHKDTEILDQYALPYQVLDTAGYLQRTRPALAAVKRDKFVGALRLPGDETGRLLPFTQRLAKMAEALGKAKFRSASRSDRIAQRPAQDA